MFLKIFYPFLFLFASHYKKVSNDPLDVAERLSKRTMMSMTGGQEYKNMSDWSYQGALIVRGLWEIQHVFETLNIEQFLHQHLNFFQTDPSQYGFKILNEIPFNTTFRTIGDDIGLFPIAYADRLRYAKNRTSFSADNDTLIIRETVEKFISGYPFHLSDETISRTFWAEGLIDERAKFVWIDDNHMGTSLNNELSRLTGNPEYVLKSMDQHLLFHRHLCDELNDGIYFHGYNNLTGQNSCCKWGRGNGWAIMGKVDTLLTLADMRIQDSKLRDLISIFKSHCLALKSVQSSSGGWHNVVTSSEAFVETSGTAMNIYAFIKGVENGWLDKDVFAESIEKGWSYLSTAIQSDGTVIDIVQGTGVLLQEELYNRSRDYKLSGPGLGSVLRAVAAYGQYKGTLFSM